MGAFYTLAWYVMLLSFGVYSVIFSIVVRALKLGSVLGVVFAVSAILAYITREFVFYRFTMVSPLICIIFFAGCMIISNVIVELGARRQR